MFATEKTAKERAHLEKRIKEGMKNRKEKYAIWKKRKGFYEGLRRG